MTFHFARLAPPGAFPPTRLAARWVLCPLTRRRVLLRDRTETLPAIPAQPAPARTALPLTGPRAA